MTQLCLNYGFNLSNFNEFMLQPIQLESGEFAF